MKLTLIRLISSIITFSLCVITIGCNDLSRNEAKSIILERIKSDNKLLHITYDFPSWNYGIEVEEYQYENAKILEKAGYITIVDKSENWASKTTMTLQPKIGPFYFYSPPYVCIILASVKDIVITGISGDDSQKKVEYTRIYSESEINKLINVEKDFSSNHYIVLYKYDDGWRWR